MESRRRPPPQGTTRDVGAYEAEDMSDLSGPSRATDRAMTLAVELRPSRSRGAASSTLLEQASPARTR